VETNRRDKSFPMRSPEVSREIGARIVRATGLRVDVHRPHRVVNIEIAEEGCFVYTDVVPGPGGLPVGVSGNVAVLLSGGIDSPVAAWSAMRRGCRAQAIYFHSFPYTGDKTREKVTDLARLLAQWQGGMTLWVVGFTEVQKALREAVDGELAVLAYRRMMMRAAGLIARREGSSALVTGENLGQVASQTLENLAAIEAAAPLPVLRPLITFDKREIIAQAQRIGTYETSILPYDDCCALFVPKHPVTRCSAQVMDKRESRLDVAAMAATLAEAAERVEVA
jgi:thiamine biosynthesis protein ThiI